MYETEVNLKHEPPEYIPEEVARRFGECKGTVLNRTVLPWSEHCTECAWPTCYSTCEFYRRRPDGKCRRFADGMIRVDCPEALNSYLLKITFMQWAKLWSPGTLQLHPSESALRIEKRDYRIGLAIQTLPMPRAVRAFTSTKRYRLKTRGAYSARSKELLPSCFLLECYNPDNADVQLSFTIRPDVKDTAIAFQKLITIPQGFHRVRIPYTDISSIVDLTTRFNVELVPNHRGTATLYFGLMDFVIEASEAGRRLTLDRDRPNSKLKCVVWDLDNTIWDGILLEDGPEAITLKPQIKELLQELDRRGILLSIASKNNRDDACAALRRMGLEELFVSPRISWQPKSISIQEIALHLNIGLDTFLFVDDSSFEREEVISALPSVRVMDARHYLDILNLDECRVPVTPESQERRKMYILEAERRNRASTFAGDYMAFLRDCEIQAAVAPLAEDNLERVHELTQRTHQMNFSGTLYDRDLLRNIIYDPHIHGYVLDVVDRFGSYGIVGFCVIDSRTPIITDLMFSCRIQSKRIEHAFLAWIVQRYIHMTGRDVWALYRKTAHNALSGKVFADLGMAEVGIRDGVSTLLFRHDCTVPDDHIVQIIERATAPVT